MKVGIINVTGYAGVELARILHGHADADIACVTGRSAAGTRLGEVFPHLSALDLAIAEDLDKSVDVVFSALPHGASAERLAPLIQHGVKTVDISADFRLRNVDEYQTWYNTTHPCPQYLEDSVYGLPELHGDEVSSANLVANPGCHATAAVLALAPAIGAGIIDTDIIVDVKTGISGGGRELKLQNHYSEVNENVAAYAINGHRHLPEMTQELNGVAGSDGLRLTFLPHLVPMTRGILASCYASLRDGVVASGEGSKEEVREIYEEFYRGAPFVRVTDSPPATKQTLGSNVCAIHPTVDTRTNRLLVVSCIDNLVKGAAGQAVQNMNLMFGLPEDEGLSQLALYP